MHQTWLRMKIRPRTAFCYWLSSPRRRGPELDPSLHSCEMKPFQSLSLRAETNKDNYRQRIHFILAATSVSWGSTCSIQRWLVCWDYLPPLLCYLFITCSRALSNSYYTVGPGAAWASRTKLCISDLKPCSFGPSVSSWREKREWKKKVWKENRKRRWRRRRRNGRKRGEERACSCGRVQIEFHINVCKFPRSCWLRLEKLISWMQRQYWCHQAERGEKSC